MKYREVKPAGAARRFVECYWTLEVDNAESAMVQRVVPDGYPELILNLGRPFECFRQGAWRIQPGAFLAGQITAPLLLRPSGPARILGVRFLPQGAGQLLGLPMRELAGQTLPIDELSPALWRELLPVFESAAPLRTLQTVLDLPRGTEDAMVGEAVRLIAAAHGACEVGDLATLLGVSSRQLERRFGDRVGLSPKIFARIQRFQQVFRAIESGSANWVDTAVACGYYDQAHLIRDFKDFSGASPAVLLLEDTLARHFLTGRSLSHSYKTNTRRPL